jgi:hypothetical protein
MRELDFLKETFMVVDHSLNDLNKQTNELKTNKLETNNLGTNKLVTNKLKTRRVT